jgi:anaerobic magnesium-protoporphyrin IX monomethyl ester cyclase
MSATNLLLIMPDDRALYARSIAPVDLLHTPSLALASLGAVARKHDVEPTVLDLTLVSDAERAIADTVERLHPRWVGITATTPLYEQAVGIARVVKGSSPDSRVLVGGPHVTFLVDDALEAGCFDAVFVGEAEGSFARLLRGEDPRSIEGVRTPGDGRRETSVDQAPSTPLDELPVPEYGLYPLSRYRLSRFYVQENPAVWMETGRGCPSRCRYCSKGVHGRRLRNKSPERVVAEFRQLAGLGVRELLLADNTFTQDLLRAERICDLLVEARLPLLWQCANGLRVDRVRPSLLAKMRRAGCYRISLGIESGDQKVLDASGKGISLQAAEAAVRMARDAGIEVWGFFLMGFPEETKESMRRTIEFARRLPLDVAKVNIIIPYPDSALYAEYKAAGLMIPGVSFTEFNSNASPRRIYRHPSLTWDAVERHQRMFYRSFYFNPRYLLRRAVRSLRSGSLVADVRNALRSRLFRTPPS